MNEAELLFTDILKCDRLSLYQNRNLFLGKDNSSLIASALKRRIAAEPIQYILGKTEFMGIEFKVDGNVLIPRTETEILVETAVKYVTCHLSSVTCPAILDAGTGSGNIAISLAKFLPYATLTAIDISKKAIELAKQNALLNNVKINFFVSDLFSNNELKTDNYELIISNPPYIAGYEINDLQPEIGYEPRIALDGGNDGLDFYRRIIDSAHYYLKEAGFLIMEMGFNQRAKIENILKKSGNFEIIDIVKDYNNIDRVIVIRRNHTSGSCLSIHLVRPRLRCGRTRTSSRQPPA